MQVTQKDNYFLEYKAYDLMTYEFYHNEKQLSDTIEKYGYKLEKIYLYDNIYDLLIGKKNDEK